MKHKWFIDRKQVCRCSNCNVIWNKSNRDEECMNHIAEAFEELVTPLEGCIPTLGCMITTVIVACIVLGLAAFGLYCLIV